MLYYSCKGVTLAGDRLCRPCHYWNRQSRNSSAATIALLYCAPILECERRSIRGDRVPAECWQKT
ncbi:MAG: hypothetical protein F6J93_34850 [Oscillatoria sp. SIO1A7]|nr:hypothetical protein [Oscillatoria sp. SIO1A7]